MTSAIMTSDKRPPLNLPAIRAAACLGLCLLVLAPASVLLADAVSGNARFLGQSLAEALRTLERDGLRLVYTDRLVTPDLRVLEEPQASDPRRILDELLRPHGLTVQDADGVLVVVPGEPPAPVTVRLEGRIRADAPDADLSGIRVWLPERDLETVCDVAGRFVFPRVEAGDLLLRIEGGGYLAVEERVSIDGRERVEIEIRLARLPEAEETIEVASTGRGPLVSGLSMFSFSHNEFTQLPSLGSDALRPLTVLPGAAGNDVSARFHVRGGRADEVMVVLDGHEILEAFHLKDFNSALSILAPEAIERTELLTGGFPASYGDRMSGVLTLTSREHNGPGRAELALQPHSLEVAVAGALPGVDVTGLAVVRGGSFELVAELANDQRDPSFFDAFGKADWQATPGQSLRGRFLVATDHLTFLRQITEDEEDGEDTVSRERFDTAYENGYLWFNHVGLRRHFFVASRMAYSRVDRDRRGDQEDGEGALGLADRRQLDVLTWAQEGEWQLGGHDLSWGYEYRRLETDYDYFNTRQLTGVLARIRDQPGSGTTRLVQSFDGSQHSIYVHDQIRPSEALQLDLGLRFDKNSVVDDKYLSPRVSLAWTLDERRRLRFAWGHFYQSQRLYELQVADGETRFQGAERAEHRILGYEQDFALPWRGQSWPLTWRVEAYSHHISDPRARFENLFDPISIVPELEADRVRLEPERSESAGVELSLSGRLGSFDAFTSYTYSGATDRFDGRRVPRSIDQPHAFKIDVTWRSPWKWQFHGRAELRSGWPTTAIGVRLEEGADGQDEDALVPVLGELYGERLATYFRLDARASRLFQLKRGELLVHVDVQNLTNYSNVRGFDIDFALEEGVPTVVKERKIWSNIVPSFGVRWRF